MKWVKWFNYNVKINIKLYYISVLNKTIKWEENMYIKKRYLYENKCLYQITLSSIE